MKILVWAYFYQMTVTEYGNREAITAVPWMFNVAVALHALVSAIVQVRVLRRPGMRSIIQLSTIVLLLISRLGCFKQIVTCYTSMGGCLCQDDGSADNCGDAIPTWSQKFYKTIQVPNRPFR
jgi:hypothetical protein